MSQGLFRIFSSLIVLAVVGCQDRSRYHQEFLRQSRKPQNPLTNPQTAAEIQEQTSRIIESTLKAAEAAESSSTCRDLSKLAQTLLPNISQNAKINLLNTMLVNLKGAKCDDLVAYIKDALKDDPVRDLVDVRVNQMKNLDERQIILMVQTNQDLYLDAGDVWRVASNPPQVHSSADTVTVSGYVHYRTRSIKVATTFAKADFTITNPTTEDMVRLTQGKRVQFSKMDSTTPVISQVANNKFEEAIKAQMGEIQRDPETTSQNIEKRKQLPLKLTFDFSDMNDLVSCGSRLTETLILMKTRKSSQELSILGVVQNEKDSPLSHLLTRDKAQLAEEALTSPPKQKRSDEGFWKFPNKNEKALWFVSTGSIISEEGGSPLVQYTFTARSLEKSEVKRLSSKEGSREIILGYDRPLGRRNKPFSVILDPPSAVWLKTRIEDMASCLQREGATTEGVSRDSLRDFIFYSIFQNEMDFVIRNNI